MGLSNKNVRPGAEGCIGGSVTDKEYPTILIATGNPGKVRELRELLAPASAALKSLSEFSNIAEVPETGSTFMENAEMKAAGYARQTGLWSLADDSGLSVDALGGLPGVLSARYGGDVAFDRKMELLLSAMNDTKDKRRSARFTCAMALCDQSGTIRAHVEGLCEGIIAARPRGNGGFGYDPIFVPNGFESTFGELSAEIKAEISHRSLAAAKIMRYLLAFRAV